MQLLSAISHCVNVSRSVTRITAPSSAHIPGRTHFEHSRTHLGVNIDSNGSQTVGQDTLVGCNLILGGSPKGDGRSDNQLPQAWRLFRKSDIIAANYPELCMLVYIYREINVSFFWLLLLINK